MKKLALAAVVLLAVVANVEAFGHRKAARSGCAGMSACSGTMQVTVTKVQVGCHGVATTPKPLEKPKPLPPQAVAPQAAPPVVFIQAAPRPMLFGRLRGGSCGAGGCR